MNQKFVVKKILINSFQIKKKEIISFQFEQVDVLSTLNILEIHSFDFFQGLDNPKTTKK